MSNDSLSSSEVVVTEKTRQGVIVRTSIIGIAANILLAAFKAAVGYISNSIAVTLDAVNNLSDALSSVITIVGTKLAGKRPDKKHPLGHGRAEYLSTMIIAAIVLYAGITSLTESIKKIISPEQADYSTISLIIISVAVVVKIVLGKYVKSVGKKVSSGSLVASGSDALFDAIISLSVLACALIYIKTGVSLEAYVGIIISGFIIKSGIEMLIDTVNDILGRRSDPELSRRIKDLISSHENVNGAYDLIINNYGPGKEYASVHIEVPDYLTAKEIDELERHLQSDVYTETGVILTGISVYSQNTQDLEAKAIYENIRKNVLSHEWVLQIHGFYIDKVNHDIRFDTVLDFALEPEQAVAEIKAEVEKLYPEYSIMITPDIDVSD